MWVGIAIHTKAACGYVGSGPRYPVLAAPRRFEKTIQQQGRLLGGGRRVSESDGDMDEGADSAVQRRISRRNCQHLEEDWQKCMEVSEIVSRVSHV